MGRRKQRAPRRARPAAARKVRASRTIAALTGLALALVVSALLALGWLLMVYPHVPAPGRGQVWVTLEPDASLASVSRDLAGHGIVESPWTFALYLRLVGARGHVREGNVRLARGMTPAAVAHRIAPHFGPVDVRVVVPEGFHRFDVARRLEEHDVCSEAGFLAATESSSLLARHGIHAPSAEGYLFPDTYELRTESACEEVVERFLENFERRVHPLLRGAGLDVLREDLGFGRHSVVTLASIVEEEAAVSDERPMIAGVFLNRLRSETFLPRARLQADPTVSYGCLAERDAAPSCAGFAGTITRAMLDDPLNRYNTYRHGGLPPGPISNPGISSIRAVLEPASHQYLYFVAKGRGRHRFSETLDAHNAAVEQYQRTVAP